MKKLVTALMIAAFAGMTSHAFAGHGSGKLGEDDGTGKKHGKKHPKSGTGGDKSEKTDDAKK